jgi:transcriptional regulator NrdR family protein
VTPRKRNAAARVNARTVCPYCGDGHSAVVSISGIRRRRDCLQCGRRYSTQEVVVTERSRSANPNMSRS